MRDFSQAAVASDTFLPLDSPKNPRFSRFAGTGTIRPDIPCSQTDGRMEAARTRLAPGAARSPPPVVRAPSPGPDVVDDCGARVWASPEDHPSMDSDGSDGDSDGRYHDW